MGLTASGSRRLGRFTEPAMWILVTLDDGPRTAVGLLDGVRSLDGPIGHGTLLGALARLERLGLVDQPPDVDGRSAYRLSEVGSAAARAAARLTTISPTEVGRA